MAPLEIQRIYVRKGALDIEVSCTLDALHVTPEQADHILGLYPNLSNHICVNERDDLTFGAEIIGTELPHLMEHLIIELQGQQDSDSTSKQLLSGHTSWLEELDVTGSDGFALMQVTVTFNNDLIALQAVKDACNIINQISG